MKIGWGTDRCLNTLPSAEPSETPAKPTRRTPMLLGAGRRRLHCCGVPGQEKGTVTDSESEVRRTHVPIARGCARLEFHIYLADAIS